MTNGIRALLAGALLIVVTGVAVMTRVQAPLGEFHKVDQPLPNAAQPRLPMHDGAKKTVVILAGDQGTEIVDLLVPYAILSRTDQLNVYVVSLGRLQVPLWKGLSIQAHYEGGAFPHTVDAVIVPAMNGDFVAATGDFLNRHPDVVVLSVCEGASIVAQLPRYRNHRLTTHASAIDELSQAYPWMSWVRGARTVSDRNLISTAGVASSANGALALVAALLGPEAAHRVAQAIRHPLVHGPDAYRAAAVSNVDYIRIGWKLVASAPRIGVQLIDRVDELAIAAWLDTLNRTFPARIETFGASVISLHGLTMTPTQTSREYDIRVCFADCSSDSPPAKQTLAPATSVYAFDAALAWVRHEYGAAFEETVRRLLDY